MVDRPIWVRVLVQLAMPSVMIVVVALFGFTYVYVAYATTSGADPIKEGSVNTIYLLCALVATGALAAALSGWLVGRPWDGLGGVGLFAAAMGGVTWIEHSFRQGAGAEDALRAVPAMVTPLVGCVLAAWLLERRKREKPPSLHLRLPTRPWEAQ